MSSDERTIAKAASWSIWGKAWLSGARLPILAGLLAVLLASPSLSVGWILDDYYHRSVLLGRSRFRDLLGTPAEMFRFFRGDPDRARTAMNIGLWPWWIDPSIKAEFLQALTVLTHELDYALWPDSPVLMHAHNLFWLGAAVTCVAVYYRRMMGRTWVAGAAALLFAIDDARGATVGFIANRNVLIAATFGVSALIFHDRWRRGGSRASAALAPIMLAAALFSKEEGIGTCAYLASYALLIDPAGWRRGCLALSPYLAVVALWRWLRSLWGYGVWNVGVYIDPLSDPGRFVAALAARLPLFLLGQWSPLPAECGLAARNLLFSAVWWIAMASFVILLAVMAELLRRDRLARFWFAGMVFAVIPVCATGPMDRLLTFAGIGAFGLLARFWEAVFDVPRDVGSVPHERRALVVSAWVLVGVHAILAPLVLPFRSANPLGPRWVENRLYVHTPLSPAAADQTLVIVNAPSPAHANYLLFLQDLSGGPVPRQIRALAPAIPSVRIRRLDDRSLAIRPKRGYMNMILDRVFRSERRPMSLGEQVKLAGMTVEIKELTEDGRPADATFRFDVPLESPSLLWLCFRGTRFEPFALPRIGEECEIPFDWRAMLSPFDASRAQPSTHHSGQAN